MCDAPSSSRYKSGCRCEACREAQRVNQRAYYRSVGGNKNRKPEVVKAYYERNKAKYGGARKRYPEAARRGDALRRARKAGVESESFSPRAVFVRDGWVCGICELPVDQAAKWPDPGSPSLDHIVPLSKGGPHTRANTRLAHLYCNGVRGNREIA